MNFDLTPEQAATLSSAAHLVMEYLPVSETKRKALSDAQQALHKGIGTERLFQSNNLPTARPLSERENRAWMTYTYGDDDHNSDENLAFHSPNINLWVYYDRSCEDVAVTLSFDLGTFLVKGTEPDDAYYKEITDRPYPDILIFMFPAWYGSKVGLTISTPTGMKEAAYLLTKQGVIAESRTIIIDVDCEGSYRNSTKEPA